MRGNFGVGPVILGTARTHGVFCEPGANRANLSSVRFVAAMHGLWHGKRDTPRHIGAGPARMAYSDFSSESFARVLASDATGFPLTVIGRAEA